MVAPAPRYMNPERRSVGLRMPSVKSQTVATVARPRQGSRTSLAVAILDAQQNGKSHNASPG